ncbi:MAG TPA: ABC transporter substrate-binding protein/permease [Planctomycetota bacterium]|nr:ABC transporter substrate-binding protein/permease [Planctomycetota bacterium]
MEELEPSPAPRRTFAWIAVLALAAGAARGQDAWEGVRSTGRLRWGSDAEGGAPYQFNDPRDPTQIIGFEVEIAEALAAAMGVRAERVQNAWAELIPGLERGDYEVAISGIEIVGYRLERADFSRPYYAGGETLMVRKGETRIASLADLRGKSVGTLRDSSAHRMLQSLEGVDVRPYDDQIHPYDDLEIERTDAVLLDEMIALYYGLPRQGLKVVGEPIGEVRYGIAVRKGNPALLSAVDAALDQLVREGRLRPILERWNLWNGKTASLLGDFSPRKVEPVAYQEFRRAMGQDVSVAAPERNWRAYAKVLGRGAWVTVELTCLGMVLAVVLGLVLALARLYAPRPLPTLALGYIEAVRGTPLLIQLLLLYYGLAQAGVLLPAFVAGFVGLGLNYASAEAENYRAGLQAIPKGQWEAAAMLGLTRGQTLRHVVVPQAIRIVIPSVTNDFIAMFKDSSLVSVIALVELTKAYQDLAPIAGDYLAIGLVAAAIYLGMGAVVAFASRRLERRLRVEEATVKGAA